MATFIDGGAAEFNSLAYGLPNAMTMDYLAQQAQQVTTRLTDAGRQWLEVARETFQAVDQSEAMRLAYALARKVRHVWDDDVIREMTTIGEFQQARTAMQRWLMAEPSVRQAYHAQQCDGYSHSYVDVHGKVSGPQHYDYRRVTNGMVMENDEGGWVATTYLEELLPEDRELHFLEKVDILHTWKHLRQHMQNMRDDPTSVYNSSL